LEAERTDEDQQLADEAVETRQADGGQRVVDGAPTLSVAVPL